MKKLVFALLVRGPKANDPNQDLEALQSAHLNHLNKLKEEGILLLAGPFQDADQKRGIVILNTHSIAAARSALEADPGFQAGRFSYEYNELLVPPGTEFHLGEIPL